MELDQLLFSTTFVCYQIKYKKISNHFVDGRHHSDISFYLSQSYFETPKIIRTNCTNLILFKPVSKNDLGEISRDNNIDQSIFYNLKPYELIYFDKFNNKITKHLMNQYYNTFLFNFIFKFCISSYISSRIFSSILSSFKNKFCSELIKIPIFNSLILFLIISGYIFKNNLSFIIFIIFIFLFSINNIYYNI